MRTEISFPALISALLKVIKAQIMSKKPPKVETNGEKRKEPIIKPERLPSLFSATTRDLSLTRTNQRAQAVNKKSYAPNLNVTRNKNA